MAARIVIVTGPTASGKSGIALSIAEKTGGVIINADSQQMYHDLRILTARPSPQDEARAPHKLYGCLGAEENCSAGAWLKLARMEIDWALAQGALPIITGGTGLYLKALLQGIADIPTIDPMIRAQSAADYEQMGKDAFAQRLREVDPGFFERLKVYDKQRLIRAYEVWLGSGRPLSWWQQQAAEPPYPAEHFSVYQIDIPREELYRRCDERFAAMIEQGAVEEVRNLLPPPPLRGREGWGVVATNSDFESISPPPTLTLPLKGGGTMEKIIGVRELAAYIRQEIRLEQAIAQAQQATRNYAKRQLTWFRHQLRQWNPQAWDNDFSRFSLTKPR